MSENTPKTNPLLSMLRQPKVYITLPSGGKYWREGSLNPTINGEYPVYSMTARDEIILKTPDALLNGQGVVDVIQSCMPNIIDAWEAPQIDLDVILVAIRMATYGENLTLEVNHETMEGPMDFQANLREILDRLQSTVTWEDRVEVRPDLVLYVKPIDYRTQSTTQITEFETQRMMTILRDQDLEEDVKLNAFKQTFDKISTKALDLVNRAVYKIESSAGTTDNPEFISEFMRGCDAEIFEKVKKHVGEMNDRNALPPLKFQSTPEMLEKGAPPEIEVPFVFDAANFFV